MKSGLLQLNIRRNKVKSGGFFLLLFYTLYSSTMIMDGLVDYKTWLPVPPLAAETILRLGTASATIEFVRTEIEFDLDFLLAKIDLYV